MKADEIKVGDEVRVFDVNRSRVGQPEVGSPGKVIRVGRKLVDIQCGGFVGSFRLDTGRVNDNYGHQYFKTLEQAASDGRRDAALQVLRERKVSLQPGHTFTGGQIEKLADLVRSFGRET